MDFLDLHVAWWGSLVNTSESTHSPSPLSSASSSSWSSFIILNHKVFVKFYHFTFQMPWWPVRSCTQPSLCALFLQWPGRKVIRPLLQSSCGHLLCNDPRPRRFLAKLGWNKWKVGQKWPFCSSETHLWSFASVGSSVFVFAMCDQSSARWDILMNMSYRDEGDEDNGC